MDLRQLTLTSQSSEGGDVGSRPGVTSASTVPEARLDDSGAGDTRAER
jgi:hypothetical protein